MLSIDCQSHVFPQEYAELLTRNKGRLQTSGGGGIYTINYWDVQRFRLDLELYSIERKLAAMDAAGIDMSVLSVNIPSPELLDPELALQGAQICNNFLAEICQKYPERFVAIASLALSDVASAITELDRAIDELDLRGVFLVSNINDHPLDAPQFEPFYAHVAARNIPLVLHPTVASWQGSIQSHSMIPMMGFMIDTSFGMMQLLLGGVLERHPTLKVVHPHTGGVVPYLMGRIQEQTEVKGRGRDNITKPPMDYYENVYQDLVSPSAQAIRYAVEFSRPDRLLFGSDHPWVSIETILDPVRELDIPQEVRSMIMGQNASRLFGIE
ncbi:MAG: amidohydrolase family protein [Chloroflexota bacterium]